MEDSRMKRHFGFLVACLAYSLSSLAQGEPRAITGTLMASAIVDLHQQPASESSSQPGSAQSYPKGVRPIPLPSGLSSLGLSSLAKPPEAGSMLLDATNTELL